MLMPSRVKFRKSHRSPLRGISKGGTTVAFGDYGIKTSNNRGINEVGVRNIKQGSHSNVYIHTNTNII